MKNESQIRILRLLHFLYQHTDENPPVSASDILRLWEESGICTDRRSVYGDMDILKEFEVDIVRRRERQNLYFVGSRLFELPELKLLVDAVESSRFITRKKSAELVSSSQAKELNRPFYMVGTAKPDNETIYYKDTGAEQKPVPVPLFIIGFAPILGGKLRSEL